MSEGLYPPESNSPADILGALHERVHEEVGQSRPANVARSTVTIRARINLADLERHIAAVKAGGTGEGVALEGALADVGRKAAP